MASDAMATFSVRGSFQLLACAALLAACSGSGDSGSTYTPPPPRDTAGAEVDLSEGAPVDGRLDPTVRPSRYLLTLGIDPGARQFSGIAEIDVELPDARRQVYLHGQNLEIEEVQVTEAGQESQDAEWQVIDPDEGLLLVRWGRPLQNRIRLRIIYGAPFDGGLEGLYRVQVGDDAYAFTQMEPLAARKAFPCFDEPSFKAPFDVRLVVPVGMTAIANAPEADATVVGDEEDQALRVRFERTEPLPTYLIAFAVGPFDLVEATIPANDVRTTPLPFRGVAPRGQGERLAHAMEHTPRILAALEDYFGIPYPYAKLDILAVPDFGAGAMENAGAITFRDRLLLLGEDAPVGQERAFAYVMTHELAHQWFGNLVTMDWWDDLWLNEAFASWMETEIIRRTFPDYNPEVSSTRTMMRAFGADSLATARQIRNPIETSDDIHNAFDAITYAKGHSVLAMFEHYLTPEVFQQGVRAYITAHAEGNATAADLMAALDTAAGQDVTAPLTSFVSQPGVPMIDVSISCESGSTPSLTLAQSRYVPLGSTAESSGTWQIPVCARFPTGAGTQLGRACTLLTEPTGRLELTGAVRCPRWVMPNADGIGYYRFNLSQSLLDNLRRGLDTLSEREVLAFADSVDASFRAGRIDFGAAMGAIRGLARRPERAVAEAPMGLMQWAYDNVVDPSDRAAADRFGRLLYRDAQNRLGWDVFRRDDGDTRLLRESVMRFLTLTVREAQVRREAAARGRAYVGFETPADRGAVNAGLAGTAVAAAARTGGQEFFDHLVELLRETRDPQMRSTLVAGVAAVDDDELRREALQLTFNSAVRINEVPTILFGQMSDPEGREPTWAWLQENYDRVVERVGPGIAGYLPYLGARFCSEERAAEVQAFFGERVADVQGGPRNLASALERIRLCSALVEQQRSSVNRYFQ
jgi:alanyl aminopeptidase